MGDRMFTVPLAYATAFTAQIDVFEFLSGTNMPCRLYGFEFGQTTEIGDAQEEQLTLVLKRVTGAPTSGNGTAATPQGVLPGSTVASGTVFEVGASTKLTGGTSAELARIPWNVRASALYRPLFDEMPVLGPATRLVLELVTTPADSIGGFNGWATFGELL